ncbi:MAG: POTRA domain-containing protein [Bacteroidota bacterium]
MIRQLIKLVLLYFVFIFSNSFAQIINDIEINGASDFSKSQYLSWISPKNLKYTNASGDTIKSRVANELTRRGYYNFTFSEISYEITEDSQYVNYSITIIEGGPTYINEIIVSNLDSLDMERAKNELDVMVGSPFLIDELEVSFSNLLDHFENSGFPFASISVESTYFFYDSESDENLVDIYISFSKNQASTIDSITIIGNTKTKDYVIKRALRLQPGEPYSQKTVDRIPEKLNRLHFFEYVDTPLYFLNSQNDGILQIAVKEKNTNSFDGIIGYIPPSNEDENGYLTGLANINLRNLFGTGRALSFKWNKIDRYSQELELKYLEPWVLELPINIDLLLFQRQQDSSYVQRLLNSNFEFLATESMSAALIFSQDYTIPTESETMSFTVFNSTIFTSGVNLKIDTRDDFLVPTSGLFFLNSYKYRSKKINGPAEFVPDTINTTPTQYSIELDFVMHYKFFNRQIPTIGIHLRELRGNNIEISDMYRLGGTNTLRGYRENQFEGNRLLWTNIEYRYLLGRRSYAFLFMDVGYYLRDALPSMGLPNASAVKLGYGLGITFETGLGLLGVSYALAKGDSFNKGKIHFGLIGEF